MTSPSSDLDARIRAYGREIFARLDRRGPLVFSPAWLDEQLMNLSMADDAVIYEQGWVEVSKDEYVTGHLPGDIAYSAGMTDRVVSRRVSVNGSFAIVLTQGRTTGTHEGKPVDRESTETMVLKRVKGQWRIIHIHWSSHAAKP